MHTHTLTQAHTQTQSSHLYTGPRLCSISPSASLLTPPPLPLLFFHSPWSPSFLYDELLGAFSVWQEALSLIRDEKRAEEESACGGAGAGRKGGGLEKEKKEKEEGENLRPPGALHLHIVRICLTASQEGFTSSPGTRRGIITDQNKLPICSQQRCLPVKKEAQSYIRFKSVLTEPLIRDVGRILTLNCFSCTREPFAEAPHTKTNRGKREEEKSLLIIILACPGGDVALTFDRFVLINTTCRTRMQRFLQLCHRI